MVRLRGWIKRLERASREEFIEVEQPDGTAARFPQSAAGEAFVCLCEGRDHPLLAAARNSSDPKWSESAYATAPHTLDNLSDLSE